LQAKELLMGWCMASEIPGASPPCKTGANVMGGKRGSWNTKRDVEQGVFLSYGVPAG